MTTIKVMIALMMMVMFVINGYCADSDDQKPQPDPITITIVGRVVDVSCYVANNNDWEDKTCAINSLKVGQPAGILEESTGKLYIIAKTQGTNTNLAAELLPYAAEKVRVKGILNTRGGVKTIDIMEIEKEE